MLTYEQGTENRFQHLVGRREVQGFVVEVIGEGERPTDRPSRAGGEGRTGGGSTSL